MLIHGVTSISTTSISIDVSQAAVPYSAIAQSAAVYDQGRGLAASRSLPAEEAVRLALLTQNATYHPRLPRPSSPPEKTGLLLDIRA